MSASYYAWRRLIRASIRNEKKNLSFGPILSALAVTAGGAEVAAFLTDQGCFATFRALEWDDASRKSIVTGTGAKTAAARFCRQRGLSGFCLTGAGQEAGIDHMALDDTSDGGEQGRNIFTLKPLATAWIKHGLELLDNKGHITAAPEDGADHAGQGDGPGVMLHIFGIDEDLKRAASASPERCH